MFEGSAASRPAATSSRCRARARRSTDRPTPIAPTTGRSCRPNALELALWMESDRMGYLLPALTEAKFSNQRDVVLNERRQNYENRPYGLAPMAMLGGAVSAGSSVSLDDDRRDRRPARGASSTRCGSSSARYYHPANASLALAGDIDPDAALDAGARVLRRHRRRAARSTPVARRRRARRRVAASCSRIASSCRACTWRG